MIALYSVLVFIRQVLLMVLCCAVIGLFASWVLTWFGISFAWWKCGITLFVLGLAIRYVLSGGKL